jgi:hypothetical protein
MGQFSNAESWYKLIWTSDKEHLPKSDSRIMRDLNNLGLVYYLSAMATPDNLERELQLSRANFYLIQAELAYRDQPNHDVQDEANTLDNRYLVLRELGNKSEAKTIRAQAARIHAKVPGRIAPP